MTATKAKPSGLALWPLVGVVSDRLQCRRPAAGEDMGMGRDVLIVQVGPPVPYRLLLLEPDRTGLIRMQLWQANGKMKVATERMVMSDLVPDVLTEWAEEYNLR